MLVSKITFRCIIIKKMEWILYYLFNLIKKSKTFIKKFERKKKREFSKKKKDSFDTKTQQKVRFGGHGISSSWNILHSFNSCSPAS